MIRNRKCGIELKLILYIYIYRERERERERKREREVDYVIEAHGNIIKGDTFHDQLVDLFHRKC
jgi:hypothetical protein